MKAQEITGYCDEVAEDNHVIAAVRKANLQPRFSPYVIITLPIQRAALYTE